MKKIISTPHPDRNKRPRSSMSGAESPTGLSDFLDDQEMALPTFANPRYDITFKSIFTQEDILISFLNSVLNLEGETRIKTVSITDTFLKPDQTEPRGEGKLSIIDIHAKDRRGKSYIIEMQKSLEPDFHKRAFYYISKIVGASLKPKQVYGDIPEVVFIGVLDFALFSSKTPHYLRHFKLKDKYSDIELDSIVMVFLELEKFTKTEISEADSKLDLWAFLLRNAEKMEKIPTSFATDKGLSQAMNTLATSKWTPEKRHHYLREKLDHMKKDAERKAADEAAEAIGEARGEAKAKYAIFKNMKDQNLDDPTIQKLMGISEAQLHTFNTLLATEGEEPLSQAPPFPFIPIEPIKPNPDTTPASAPTDASEIATATKLPT